MNDSSLLAPLYLIFSFLEGIFFGLLDLIFCPFNRRCLIIPESMSGE
jgi:hypothetical protein